MTYAYHQYEYRKQDWLLKNPYATSEEYEQACTRIARELGIDNGNG